MQLDQILKELKQKISVKAETGVGDIVLVGMKPGLFYGVVQDIKSNIKKDWWDVHFKLLVIPPVDITWILRTPQMNGEIFTINGEEHFMIAVDIRPPVQLPKKGGKKPVLTLIKHEETSDE
ncbi:MAG: hypothetical protein NTZ51_06130 [Proteobacteria bacterium]|nr:hypothetical protein [Pseudomonadota bacterium]